MITCTQAIRDEFKEKDQVLTAEEIIDEIQKKYPGRWKEVAIRTHLIGCSINHKSSKWYPTFQKFLYTVGPGKVRLFDPEKDGQFKKLPNGLKVQLVAVESDPIDGRVYQPSLTIQKDLRKYLRKDIAGLEPGLKLFSGEGLDLSVETARFDILATDKKGNLVVVKLLGESKPVSTLDQILDSLVSIKNEIGERNIRCIIVAEDFTEEFTSVAKKAPGVSLVRYKVKYVFDPVV